MTRLINNEILMTKNCYFYNISNCLPTCTLCPHRKTKPESY